MGVNDIWMIDPGIKQEEGYDIYDDGTARDVWVLDAAGKAAIGRVWPGACVFPDFTMAATREWWAGLQVNTSACFVFFLFPSPLYFFLLGFVVAG